MHPKLTFSILFTKVMWNIKERKVLHIKKKSITQRTEKSPLSDALEEKPLVVDMLSSSCWEVESLISFMKESPGLPIPNIEDVEGWEGGTVESNVV